MRKTQVAAIAIIAIFPCVKLAIIAILSAMTIAGRIIEIMGGAAQVAEVVKIDVSQVHRWRWPKSRGGTDGRVPTPHQQPILDYARAHGLPLKPEDFFDPPPPSKTKQPREARA